MRKVYANSRSGFTIIEVSLVLALAGLIFLMVFIALPALQRTQRDAERREELSMITQTIKDYQENNRGALPGVGSTGSALNTAWQKFYNNYLGNLEDPDGPRYFDNLNVVQCSGRGVADESCTNGEISSLKNGKFETNNYRTVVVQQATCSGVDPVMSSNPRKVAILYTLEVVGMVCYNT